jgi:iron-sulfur cluster assembly accessory protein
MSLFRLGGESAEDIPTGPDHSAPGGVISFSPRALVEASKTLQREAGKFFRVGVSQGGCSGWNYEISIALEVAEEDTQFSFGGALPVVMSPKAIELLAGMRINYTVSLQERGFVFENPNAASTCGCGISFGV